MRAFCLTLLAALALAGPVAADTLTVKTVSASALKGAIAARRGHVVLVDFWSTTCGPCVAEFPTYVALAQSLKAKRVDFISVSADSPRDLASRVRPFLASRHASGTHYVQTPPDMSAFAAAFDPAWQPAALPRAYLYDRHGKRVRVLIGLQTRAALLAVLAPLLK